MFFLYCARQRNFLRETQKNVAGQKLGLEAELLTRTEMILCICSWISVFCFIGSKSPHVINSSIGEK